MRVIPRGCLNDLGNDPALLAMFDRMVELGRGKKLWRLVAARAEKRDVAKLKAIVEKGR